MQQVLGIDEVGMGALAGPMYVTGFLAPSAEWSWPELNDSKQMIAKRRSRVHSQISSFPHVTMVGTREEIDEEGLWVLAHRLYVKLIDTIIEKYGLPNQVIIDGEEPAKPIPGVDYIVKADTKYPSVMAASVIAKDSRDTYMLLIAKQYPGYGIEKNMGYGTPQHMNGLRIHGVSDIHRRTFRPASEMLRKAEMESSCGLPDVDR